MQYVLLTAVAQDSTSAILCAILQCIWFATISGVGTKMQLILAIASNIAHNVVPRYVDKQLLDEVFMISRIIKVEVEVIEAEADNPYRDLHYSGYHKNQI